MDSLKQVFSKLTSKPLYIILIIITVVVGVILMVFIVLNLKDKNNQPKDDQIETAQEEYKNPNQNPDQNPDQNASNNDAYALNLSEDLIFQNDESQPPTWIPSNPNNNDEGPWFGSLSLSTSQDGLTFTNEKHFLDHAGVANIILTSDDLLIATFQYFSFENEQLFDKIAYATSDDLGVTWSEIKLVNITGLNLGQTPVDPTLVELEDGSLRLYFTYHQVGNQYPQLFSAKADRIDGNFVSEGIQLTTDFIVLDPAVVQFGGKWHHYTVKHGDSFDNPSGNETLNVHSVSDDGTNFVLADDIDSEVQFLGDVIEFGDGLRFYGDSNKSAYSDDGYTWEFEPNTGPDGADPGVVELPNGSYMAIYSTL